MTTRESPVLPATLAGKYLTFVLSRESYGIPVLKVREIIRLTTITPVPQMPPFVKGVINLRGKIIPVLDLATKFGLPRSLSTINSCIVVVQFTGVEKRPVQAGIVVDGVEEVCQFAAADIEPAPEFGTAVDTTCILGLAKAKTGVKTLLDLEPVLAPVARTQTASSQT